jgi:hypothetical protein
VSGLSRSERWAEKMECTLHDAVAGCVDTLADEVVQALPDLLLQRAAGGVINACSHIARVDGTDIGYRVTVRIEGISATAAAAPPDLSS